MADEKQKLTIDGKEYLVEDLSEAAKTQLLNLRAADQKIASVQQELAMLQTARNVYAKTLGENLPED
ncbi:MAG: hypothetical protein ACSHWQ_03665 [Spongiibacteraceae bacterium]